jgi:hypothetical protein
MLRHPALEGLFNRLDGPPPQWLAMLYAYCDESGHERRDGITVIAGWFGTEAQWGLFAERWKAAGAKRFHTSNALRNKTRGAARLARLGPIPAQCGLTPFIGGARENDYWDLMQGSRFQKLAKAWCISLFPLVVEVLRAIPKDETIEFTFASQAQYSECAGVVMKAIGDLDDPQVRTSDGTPKIASWRFMPYANTPLFGPADYLAYASMQWLKDANSIQSRLTAPIRDSIANRMVGRLLDRESIRHMLTLTNQRTEGGR